MCQVANEQKKSMTLQYDLFEETSIEKSLMTQKCSTAKGGRFLLNEFWQAFIKEIDHCFKESLSLKSLQFLTDHEGNHINDAFTDGNLRENFEKEDEGEAVF